MRYCRMEMILELRKLNVKIICSEITLQNYQPLRNRQTILFRLGSIF